MSPDGVSQYLGQYYIAPYQISVNGTTYNLICDDAYDEVTPPENWAATTETFSNLTSSGLEVDGQDDGHFPSFGQPVGAKKLTL